MSNSKNNLSSESAIDLIISGIPVIDCHISGDLNLYKVDEKLTKELVLINCIIDNLVSPSIEFKNKVIFENSYFCKCSFNYTYFLGGLTIDNCVFESYLDFEAGGHNQNNSLFTIKNSHFKSFVNFFDCWFQSGVEIINNHFEKGTNILGNRSEPYRVQFDISPLIESNVGLTDLDGEGDKIVNTIIIHNQKE